MCLILTGTIHLWKQYYYQFLMPKEYQWECVRLSEQTKMCHCCLSLHLRQCTIFQLKTNIFHNITCDHDKTHTFWSRKTAASNLWRKCWLYDCKLEINLITFKWNRGVTLQMKFYWELHLILSKLFTNIWYEELH